jgi:uncharacterized membrane protein
MTLPRNVWLIALAAICLFYVLLRFWNLTESCLWFDEIFSVHAARHSWTEMFWFVAQDLIHPPLFYALLKIWIFAGGESIVWLRLFPVVFSTLALAPLFFLCRELKLKYETVAVALLFLAINGALVKYAQEVRMYAVFFCLALFSLWIFARYFIKGKNIWILTLLNVLLVYTHYFGWLLVLAQICAIAVLQRIKIRQMAIMFAVLLAAYAPWIYTVWRAAQIDSNLGQNIGWIAKPNFAAVLQFVFDVIEPFYFQASSIDAASNLLISIPLLLILIAAAIFWFADWKNKSAEEKQTVFLLLILTTTPTIFALALSWILPHSIWGTRHLIFVFAPVAILLAIFLTDVKIKYLKIAFLSAIFLLSLFALLVQFSRPPAKFIWCAWENLARDLDKTQPTKVYVFEDLVAYHFWFAARDSDRIEIVRVRGIPEMLEDKAYFLPRGFAGVRIADENAMTDEKFWLAFRDAAFNENHPPLKNLRAKGYRIGEPKIFEASGLKAILVEVMK